MRNKGKSSRVLAISSLFLTGFFLSFSFAQAQIVYQYDFEGGWDGWSASNGVWEVGPPTYGPASAFSPPNCAGTILDGNYPYATDSRLESPLIQLPDVNVDTKEIVLRFWHWFSYSREYYDDDRGTVQIWTTDTGWKDLHTIWDISKVWCPLELDVTQYKGKFVRIGFLHKDYHDAVGNHESSGWYVDDVKIAERDILLFDIFQKEDFESNWDNWWWNGWWVSNGVWEVGEPGTPPGPPCSEPNCAGTVLDGTYPIYTDSRLISPKIDLPSDSFLIRLRFCHWFSYATEYYEDDYGQVQIQTFENGVWSSWTGLHTVTEYSTVWSPLEKDLTDYAGKRVRIGFLHVDNSDAVGHHESWGWYVDDFQIICYDPHFPAKPDIKINGLNGPLLIRPVDNVRVTVQLDPRDDYGKMADWWIGMYSPFGCFWCLSLNVWKRSNTPLSIGKSILFSVPPVPVLNFRLPEGMYVFFFVLDDVPDGFFGITWYDYVELIVSN